eukprot:TRINITY_DN7816_c0_g1_i1.p1 TRINITY_DN7816_c0_g1~~TRINITY_DN7816_c0_g1_i1.p1  ORF type:complete len:641 (-),score=147.46 TRINITY_DN7816_c0_g1_i1:499-2421(-)
MTAQAERRTAAAGSSANSPGSSRLIAAHGIVVPLWVSQLPMLCNLLLAGPTELESRDHRQQPALHAFAIVPGWQSSHVSSPSLRAGNMNTGVNPRPLTGGSGLKTSPQPSSSANSPFSMATVAATVMTAMAFMRAAGADAKRRRDPRWSVRSTSGALPIFSRLARQAGSKNVVAGAQADKIVIAPGEQWRKWATFACCFFGYSVFYFTRQSLSYTAPVLKDAMGWSGLAELGKLSSLFPLAYGTSRFIGGVLGDRMSPKNVFLFGLVACGGLNVAFGCSNNLFWFSLFWVLNGSLQGLGAPPCVKMLTNWFDASERGFWWAIWHASINLGGFLIPFLAGGLAQTYGWRYGMWGPGFVALASAAICFVLMKDGPDSMMKAKKAAAAAAAARAAPVEATGDAAKDEAAKAAAAAAPAEEKKVGLVDFLFKNPMMWSLAGAYSLQYICRTGMQLWGVFFLLSQGVPSAAKAAALFSGFELGGFFGNLTAGSLSDKLLARSKPEDGQAGQRAKVACAYLSSVALLLPLFMKAPPSQTWLQYGLLFLIGHSVAGTQLLLPLIAAEVAPPHLLATSNGFMGWIGYFGAASAGLPLSVMVQQVGWGGFFAFMAGAAILGGLLLFSIKNAKSWRQLQQQQATPEPAVA